MIYRLHVRSEFKINIITWRFDIYPVKCKAICRFLINLGLRLHKVVIKDVLSIKKMCRSSGRQEIMKVV